ncbi:MAG TPA: isochorismate synthase [Acidimicrobiales bacterium]|nr:isochorismate synthase [Acidimicrobiales bacterium]
MNRSPGGLVAARLPLDPGPPIDPFALAGPDGILFHTGEQALVGLGRALTIALPHGLDSASDLDRVRHTLAAIPCEDRLGPVGIGIGVGVVGFGALPFERSRPASLVVPEITVGTDASGEMEWVTVVARDRSDLPSGSTGLRAKLHRMTAPRSGRAGGVLSPVRVDSLSSDESFEAMVAEALVAIGDGKVAKVVLARQVDVQMEATVEIAGLLRRWHELEPNCTVFAVPTPDGRFVGASPELLVERSGRRVHSRPLAGTAGPPTGTRGIVPPVELLESRKDGNEHRLVVEAIEQALRPLCSDLDVPPGPHLVHLHHLTHLGTSVTGTLAGAADGTVPTALHLVAALHPTPAVGGVPSAEACRLINRLEPRPRGNYAGPVGYVDSQGNGRWMVGIRAMSVEGRRARMAAGVGIVSGSEPAAELVEANLKLTAVFDALAPGVPFTTSPIPVGHGTTG